MNKHLYRASELHVLKLTYTEGTLIPCFHDDVVDDDVDKSPKRHSLCMHIYTYESAVSSSSSVSS